MPRRLSQLEMRRHGKNIAGLAFTMNVTQKRVRQVRERGLDDKNGVRDWLEFITGEDPGPLPQRYRIRRQNEAFDCPECGVPLGCGDYAYDYACSAYCSVKCCRDSISVAAELGSLEFLRGHLGHRKRTC